MEQEKTTNNILEKVAEYEARKKQEMDFVDKEMKYLEKMHRYFKLKAEIAEFQLREITATNQLYTNNVVHQTVQPGGQETKTE